MTVRLQIIIGVLIIVFLLAIIRAVRAKRLEFRFSLPWLFLLLALLLMDIFPGIADWLTRLAGIELPINLLTFCGLGFSLVLIFTLTTSLSRLSERQKKLVQEMALLNKRLEELKNESRWGSEQERENEPRQGSEQERENEPRQGSEQERENEPRQGSEQERENEPRREANRSVRMNRGGEANSRVKVNCAESVLEEDQDETME